MVSRVLKQQAAKIGFRAEEACCYAGVHRIVAPLGALQIAVTPITDIAESGHTYPRGLGEQRDLVGAEVGGEIGCLDAAVLETVKHRTGLTEPLLGLHGSLQAPGGKRGDVKRVVIEGGESQPQVVAVEPAGRIVADQGTLLKAAYVRLEGNGVIPAAEV